MSICHMLYVVFGNDPFITQLKGICLTFPIKKKYDVFSKHTEKYVLFHEIIAIITKFGHLNNQSLRYSKGNFWCLKPNETYFNEIPKKSSILYIYCVCVEILYIFISLCIVKVVPHYQSTSGNWTLLCSHRFNRNNIYIPSKLS